MSCRLPGCCASSNQPKASGAEVAIEREPVSGPGAVGDHEARGAAGTDLAGTDGRRRLGEHRPATVRAGDGRMQTGWHVTAAVEHAVGVEPAGPTVPVARHRPVAFQADRRVIPDRPLAAGRGVDGDNSPTVGHLIDGPVGVAGGGVGAGVGAGVLAAGSAAGAAGAGWALTVGSSRSAPPQLTSSTAAARVETAGARMPLLHRPPPAGSGPSARGHGLGQAMAASRSSADSSRYVWGPTVQSKVLPARRSWSSRTWPPGPRYINTWGAPLSQTPGRPPTLTRS